MRQSWSGVHGTFSCEIFLSNEGTVQDGNEKDLPALLKPYVEKGASELVIDFTSSGYYEPASMYGGADRMGWPAEGDDERELYGAYLTGEKKITLPEKEAEALFDFFEEEISEVELESYEDEPDHDPRDDFDPNFDSVSWGGLSY